MWTGPRAAILGSIIVAAGCQTSPAVAPAQATTTPNLGPTTWLEVGLDLPPNSGLTDVSSVGPTLVAVGSTGSAPLVQLSTDGAAWVRSANMESIPTAGGAGMAAVVPAAPGLLAVGAGDAGSVAWTTTDGTTWQKVFESTPPTEAEIGAGATAVGAMASVAVGGPGFVAVGVAIPGLVDDFGGAAWTSTSGRTWTIAPSTSQLLRAPLYDVVSTTRGLVAVGGIRGAVSLTSTDGVSWILHEQRDVLEGGQFWSVVVRPDGGLVGVGDGTGAWSAVSDDGAAWREGPCTGSLTEARLLDVVAVTAGYVASGQVAGHAAIWTSSDGEVWSRVKADLGEGQVNGISVTPYGLVAVGSSIWLGPLDGIGEDGTYPPSPCGAPVPDDLLQSPDPAATPGPSGAVVECVLSSVDGAAIPSGLVRCADLGIECEVPVPAPDVVLCKVEEPAIPPGDAPAAPRPETTS